MTTRVYKLTTQDNTTQNNTLWGENVSHTTDGSGELCSKGWLHAYTDPHLAVLFNPSHANIRNPKLWLAYGSGQRKDDHGLKVGFTKLTTKRQIDLPVISTTQKVAFAILSALEVYTEPSFVTWANKWLNGENRDNRAAARWAADAAADAAAARWAAVADAAAAAAAAAAARTLDFAKIARKAMKVTP